MGKRFLAARYPLENYSQRRAHLRVNEGDFEPHHMKPYGRVSGKFSYRQLFKKKHASRQSNQIQERATKKAARRTLQEE
jgi:hypothetical protein